MNRKKSQDNTEDTSMHTLFILGKATRAVVEN